MGNLNQAGPLGEVFALDPTTSWRSCPSCRLFATVAQLHVYGPEPGPTAHCPLPAAPAVPPPPCASSPGPSSYGFS
ncbi:DUF6510 family protein [Streptomyces viridiviolaceus]|uniref:DUF6510 family protein n=1 Tax=Streptomyces viridiviolaceus TaxID=68282 RepID=A0ABW2E7A9_9ACTN